MMNGSEIPSSNGPDRARYAYQRLREDIVSGKLPPGARLLEVDLARDLQVSRTPVREALLKLVGDGLVLEVAGRGLTVVDFPEQRIRQTFEIRAALEGAATRLATPRVTPAALAELEALVENMDEALRHDDMAKFGEFNFRFHGVIKRLTENSLLIELLDNLYAALRAYHNTRNMQRLNREQVGREHRAILAALAAGDGDAAEMIARRHVERALSIWIDR